jgi:hypothetical protein
MRTGLKSKALAAVAAFALAGAFFLPAAPAVARVFVHFGIPLFGPAYPYPYYYGPPPVIYAPPPVVYTPPPAPVVAPQAQTWYYCDNPQGYYPYVSQCGSGWRQVPARP